MKYNDNGEYKDIYVKAFDTLPIGTEVDYDGSVVPSGWTEVDEVVWTNSNPTSSFSSQNITLDEIYNRIVVVFERSSTETDRYFTAIIYNLNVYTMAFGISENIIISRQTTLNGNTLSFASGQKYTTYGSNPTTDNTKMIPIKVYGYK